MPHPLDNPTWAALTTLQANLALAEGPARRFPPDVCIHGAVAEFDSESWGALEKIGREALSLFSLQRLALPPGWVTTRSVELHEMVLENQDRLRESRLKPKVTSIGVDELTPSDLGQMSSLYAATRPGRTLSPRLHLLGGFLGIRREGQVVAMGCVRLHFPGYQEISTVATLPGHTGHGYATAIVAELAQRILDRGETPFLTVRMDNDRAIEIYRHLGFRERTRLYSTTIRFHGAP